GAQAIGRVGIVSRADDLGEINDGVARHLEGPPRLLIADVFNSGHDERGSVEDYGEGAEPGLIAVLGTIEAQHGIRKVAFEDLGGPALPVLEEAVEAAAGDSVGGAGQKLGCAWGRAGAGIKQGDFDLATGEGGIESGEISDDDAEKGEPHA